MKNYIVDIGSFNVEAETEEEATQKAAAMIKEGGCVNIDQIIED